MFRVFAASLALATVLVSPVAANDLVPLSPLPAGARLAVLPSTNELPSAAGAASLQREEAVQAVTTALRKRGYQVMPEGQTDAALAARLPDGCRDAVTCDPKLALQALGVDAVVSVALWQRKQGDAQLVVYVQRTRNYGQAELAITSASLADVAGDAVAQALDDTLERHELTVRIESEPPGASVHVDQVSAGRTPVTLELTPGSHLVIVETPGFITDAHYLEVPRGASEPFVHTVKLARAIGATEDHPDAPLAAAPIDDAPGPSRGSDAANYVLAGVLGAVALPLLVNAAYALAEEGECTGRRDPASRCSARATLGAGFWASLGVGLAAGLGAGAVLVFMPLGERDEQAPSGAAVQWRGRF
jgi:PEGA domain